jgi:hypothetical protein
MLRRISQCMDAAPNPLLPALRCLASCSGAGCQGGASTGGKVLPANKTHPAHFGCGVSKERADPKVLRTARTQRTAAANPHALHQLTAGVPVFPKNFACMYRQRRAGLEKSALHVLCPPVGAGSKCCMSALRPQHVQCVGACMRVTRSQHSDYCENNPAAHSCRCCAVNQQLCHGHQSQHPRPTAGSQRSCRARAPQAATLAWQRALRCTRHP